MGDNTLNAGREFAAGHPLPSAGPRRLVQAKGAIRGSFSRNRSSALGSGCLSVSTSKARRKFCYSEIECPRSVGHNFARLSEVPVETEQVLRPPQRG